MIEELAAPVMHAASTTAIALQVAISEQSWPIPAGLENVMTIKGQAPAQSFPTFPDLLTGRMVHPWAERKIAVVEKSSEPKRQSHNTIEVYHFGSVIGVADVNLLRQRGRFEWQ